MDISAGLSDYHAVKFGFVTRMILGITVVVVIQSGTQRKDATLMVSMRRLVKFSGPMDRTGERGYQIDFPTDLRCSLAERRMSFSCSKVSCASAASKSSHR